jgi:hypothetical protein
MYSLSVVYICYAQSGATFVDTQYVGTCIKKGQAQQGLEEIMR